MHQMWRVSVLRSAFIYLKVHFISTVFQIYSLASSFLSVITIFTMLAGFYDDMIMFIVIYLFIFNWQIAV